MSSLVPGSPNLSIQYNNDGDFGGSSYFTWDTTNLCVDFNTALSTGGASPLFKVPAANTGDNVDFRFVQHSALWTNGPVGNPDYYDDTMSWGWNIQSPQVPIDPSKGCICFTMENLFYQGVWGHEVHLQNTTTDGTQHRPIYFFIPTENATDGTSVMSQDIDAINWSTYGGTQVIEWALYNNNVVFLNGFQLLFNENNVPVMKQINASGSTSLTLPYIGSDNRLTFGSSNGFSAINATPTTGSYPNSHSVIQPTSIAAGGVILDKYAPLVTGSLYADRSTASITGDFTIALYNNASAAAANANIELRTIGTSAGDPSIKFNVNGGPLWQVGQDNSDSGKFKVSLSGFNPGHDQLTIASTSPYQAAFLGPIQTPQYTVATLPTASAALKGCRAHVTDATSPTFLGALTGGGLVVCPVFCNGAAWVAG